MKIKFIGTGSGKTSANRYYTSILLDAGHVLLVDTGDGISKALQFSNIIYSDIDSILITHFHPDHVSGLPMLLNQMKMENRKKRLIIHVYKDNIHQLIQLCELNLIFFERLGFDVRLKQFSNNNEIEISDGFYVIPRGNSHLDKFPLEEIKCFSLFFEPENIHYTSDLGKPSDILLFNDKEAEYLISECTHVTPEEILNSIEIQKLKKLFLVHVDSEDKLKSWYDGLRNEVKSKVVLTYDALEFSIPL